MNSSYGLSVNDKRVLAALFDPEALPSSIAATKAAKLIDDALPAYPAISAGQLVDLEAQQESLVHGISSSSTHTVLTHKIQEEDVIIAGWPKFPSAYLNRAMMRRLLLERSKSKDQFLSDAAKSDVEALFSDLSRAVHLTLPKSPTSSPVSTYRARILRTALSHRAYLYLKSAETHVQLDGLGAHELEELASRDFASAASYGDEVAKEMSVRTNPYAKMCGAIVKNALAKEREDQWQLA